MPTATKSPDTMTRTRLLYSIRQLIPAPGYRAVWVHPVDESDRGGPLTVNADRIDYLAVADTQAHRGGQWVDDGREVVAVELSDGYFQVCDECINFHGLVKEGASWQECVDLLPADLQERIVRREQENPSDA